MEDLRTIRKQLGMTQASFAEAMGLNQSTVSRFETGELVVDRRTQLAAQALLASAVGDAVTSETAPPSDPLEHRPHHPDTAINDDLPEPRVLVCEVCEQQFPDDSVETCGIVDCPHAARKAA